MLEFMDPRVVPTVTFRGLFAALHRCPHLHTLDIPLDAVNLDIDFTAESFQHTSLRHLDLTSSGISDAEAVARIVFSVLPSVDRVCPPEYERRPGVCLEVQKHLVSLGHLLISVATSLSDRYIGCLDMKHETFHVHIWKVLTCSCLALCAEEGEKRTLSG